MDSIKTGCYSNLSYNIRTESAPTTMDTQPARITTLEQANALDNVLIPHGETITSHPGQE